MFKVNNRNTRKRCEICSKLTRKIPDDVIEVVWWFYCWLWISICQLGKKNIFRSLSTIFDGAVIKKALKNFTIFTGKHLRLSLFLIKLQAWISLWSTAWFHNILIALKLAYNKNKLFKTLHYWSRDMLNFDFLDKGLEIVSPAHFVYDFSTKCSSCYILLTEQISLPGCLYFLSYWTICVLQLFVDQVVTSWILKLTLSFQSSRFCYMTKKSWQKLRYLENEKSF